MACIGIAPRHCMSPSGIHVAALCPALTLDLDPFPTDCALCVDLLHLSPSLGMLMDPCRTAPIIASLSSPRERLSLSALGNELFCHFSGVSSLLPAPLGIGCQNYPYPFHPSHSSACTGFHERYMLEDPFGVLGCASHVPDKSKDLQ